MPRVGPGPMACQEHFLPVRAVERGGTTRDAASATPCLERLDRVGGVALQQRHEGLVAQGESLFVEESCTWKDYRAF